MQTTNEETKQPVVIAGLDLNQSDFAYQMEELAALCQAADQTVVATSTQKLDRPVAATYFGSGKIEELAQLCDAFEASLLVVNDELTPSQLRNLSEQTGVEVIDRTALVLMIFARRATTKQAQLQVKIAQLKYQLPRLKTTAAAKLDQQTGASGGFTSRGAGETKLELDRRVIGKQIATLNAELKKIQQQEQTKSAKRRQSDIKKVALVGYTNAGKSTTMNGLLRLCHADETKQVMVKDMLFATLDTAVRHITLPDKRHFLLADTVGFVSHLPHQLVAAFKTTLMAALDADLLVQVIDGSDEHAEAMVKTTQATLSEIGVSDIPMIYAYNKADKAHLSYPTQTANQLNYSAVDDASLQKLLEMISQALFKDDVTKQYLIPYDQGQWLNLLNEKAVIHTQKYREDGTLVEATTTPKIAGRLRQFVVDD